MAVHIGTSGWHYDHWRGPFYPPALPAARMLVEYGRRFDSVEINSTFYRLPSPATVAHWYAGSPSPFCFTVKASRYLTHMKKLKDPQAGLDRLLPVVAGLREKLGPMLFQLPPHWHCDADRLNGFLEALPAGFRYAMELRDPRWHRPDISALLRRHGVAYCIFDLAGRQSPLEVTADFVYVRLHGPEGAYQGSYPDAALHRWAARIRTWRAGGLDVYCYFDNDEAGYAAHNALTLKRELRGKAAAAARI